MFVKEIMKEAVTVHQNLKLKQAKQLMKQNNIGSVLVVEKNKVVGIITEKDIVDFDEDNLIKNIMKKQVITTEPETNLDMAVELMKKNKIKRLPVVEDGELIGVVTISDIIENYEKIDQDYLF